MNQKEHNTSAKENLNKFLLNAVEISLIPSKLWQIFELDLDIWDKKKDYDLILKIKELYNNEKIVLEIHGRFIILIPLDNNPINDKEINLIKDLIESNLNKKVDMRKISEPLKKVKDEQNLANIIRKGMGEIVTLKLRECGFEKIGSGGGIGIFSIPQKWLGMDHEIVKGKIKISRAFDLSIIFSENDSKFYLSADIKGQYEELQNLSKFLASKTEIENICNWERKDRVWQIDSNSDFEHLFSNDIIQEFFEIQKVKNWEEISNNLLGWGKYSNETINILKEKGLFPSNIEQEKFVEVKSTGRIIKNPNKIITLPARFLYRNLSQPIKKEYSDHFKRFTQIDVNTRLKLISSFFGLLEKNKIASSKYYFQDYKTNFATPCVGIQASNTYGKIPNILETGVESWGNLIKLDIYYNQRIDEKIKSFLNKFQEIFEDIFLKTKTRLNLKIPELEFVRNPMHDERQIVKQILENDNSHSCPIIFKSKYIKNYKEIKKKLTQEQGIPVQVIKEDTLFKSRNFAQLSKTLIPQIIAKTGGFPYKLFPPLLDKAIIIGLDKARDSSMTKPSASAGIAAVTPDGQYISGASTELENNTTDFIDVDKLAPILLQELDEHKFNKKYDYVVILRDGSPNVCRQEVPLWKKHLENYNKEFIFLSCRKTHAFRIFPYVESLNSDRLHYEVPVILNGKPLPATDFLVLAAKAPRGTPKPVLYTLMENTTSFDIQEIKDKVLAQIISMSMLCWESPFPTSQPLPLHYADKLAAFTQLVQQSWNSSNKFPMFI